jgi:hypothetical protein
LPGPGGSRLTPAGFAEVDEPHEARTRPLRRRRKPRALRFTLVTLASLIGGALGVHYAFIPLPVLVVWSHPVNIDVRTRPPGAEVYLDGERLGAVTPVSTDRPRDRLVHAIEVRHGDLRSVRRLVRFDQEVALDIDVTLGPPSRPAVTPLPAALVAGGRDAGAADAQSDGASARRERDTRSD